MSAASPRPALPGAIERLDDLVALGITALELMPVADFPGQRNWGYDGVLPFAPEAATAARRSQAAGRRRARARADGAARRGLQPLRPRRQLPARLRQPDFFNPRHHTPGARRSTSTGEGSRTVRDFFIHNALYWLEEFHLDGLRIDAVHAMHDRSRRTSSTSWRRPCAPGRAARAPCTWCSRTTATRRATWRR
jgi:hypothetical protein